MGRYVLETSVFYTQFCCEPNMSLQSKVYLKKLQPVLTFLALSQKNDSKLIV